MGKKKSSNTGGGGADDTKHETKLQAVILADPFSNVFKPLSFDRCAPMLCPLNNVILLDYTMDFCVGAGVEELIVVFQDLGLDVIGDLDIVRAKVGLQNLGEGPAVKLRQLGDLRAAHVALLGVLSRLIWTLNQCCQIKIEQ